MTTEASKIVELEYVDSIFHKAVRQVKKNELKPWKKKGWVIPPFQNGDFMATMERFLRFTNILMMKSIRFSVWMNSQNSLSIPKLPLQPKLVLNSKDFILYVKIDSTLVRTVTTGVRLILMILLTGIVT